MPSTTDLVAGWISVHIDTEMPTGHPVQRSRATIHAISTDLEWVLVTYVESGPYATRNRLTIVPSGTFWTVEYLDD